MTERTWHCDYRPEFGQVPAMECMTAFLDDDAFKAHLDRWHPSRRRWDQPEHGKGEVLQLGFTRAELTAIEERAWPRSVETWIHEQVTAALAATQPTGDPC